MITKKRSAKTEITSSSMADIAFLLLVFFLLTTTISMDKGLNLVLPPPGGEVTVNKKNICEILVNEYGKVLMDSDVVETAEVRNVAIEKIAANPEIIFSVKTHRFTKYSDYIAILDQLKMSKAKKISIANPDLE